MSGEDGVSGEDVKTDPLSNLQSLQCCHQRLRGWSRSPAIHPPSLQRDRAHTHPVISYILQSDGVCQYRTTEGKVCKISHDKIHYAVRIWKSSKRDTVEPLIRDTE